MTRRTAIGVGIAAGAAVLVGCAAEAQSPAGSAPTGSGSSGNSASGAAAGLSTVDAIPEGGSLIVGDGKTAVALARKGQEVVAFSAICTHQGCSVMADGAVLKCPCHGSTFDAFTGAATRGPATVALATVNVSVKDGSVVQA